VEIGIRELRGRLSEYLNQVRDGDELTITDRGTAFARIVPITGGRALDRAVAEGRVESQGGIADLIGDQRR
jgi:prevent-host-death family protein